MSRVNHLYLSSVSHLLSTSRSFSHSSTLEAGDVWLHPVLPCLIMTHPAQVYPGSACRSLAPLSSLSLAPAPFPAPHHSPQLPHGGAEILNSETTLSDDHQLSEHCTTSSTFLDLASDPTIFWTFYVLLPYRPFSSTHLSWSHVQSSTSPFDHEKFLFLSR